jgi:hypothetical protein
MHFGNGRAVRNLFGEMKMQLARRVMGQPGMLDPATMDKQKLITLTLEDVPERNLVAGSLDLTVLFRAGPPKKTAGDALVDDSSIPGESQGTAA